MTRRLILIRHAKSSWDDPFADDHARILNRRGRDAAQAIGAWLATKGYMPDTVLCSDAERTRETAELILPHLSPAPKLNLLPLLYHAAPDTLLDRISRQSDGCVAIIGHNPGIGMLASAMVSQAPNHHRFADYPTCATTIIDFDSDDWAAVRPQTGKCVDFVVPRDLIGAAGRDAD